MRAQGSDTPVDASRSGLVIAACRSSTLPAATSRWRARTAAPPHLQRRDLQLRRAPRRAPCTRSQFQHHLRHRSPHRGLPRLGPQGARPLSGHVRLRDLRQGHPTDGARARPLRQEAAVSRHPPGALVFASEIPPLIAFPGADRASTTMRSATTCSTASCRARHLLPRGDQAPARALRGMERAAASR